MIEEDTNINLCVHVQVYTCACSSMSTCGSCFQVTLLVFGCTFLIILCKQGFPHTIVVETYQIFLNWFSAWR